MSWELDSTRTEPCRCGKGKVVIASYSDDWGRSREECNLECEECSKKFKVDMVDSKYKPWKYGSRVEYVERK